MSALAIAPSSTMSLFRIDEELRAYLDTIDATAEGSQERAECELKIQTFMATLPTKVDSVAATLRWMRSQETTAKTEKDWYQKRQQRFARMADGLEDYIIFVLHKQEQPKKGAKKLEGNTHTLSLGTTEVVKLLDEKEIPGRFKTASVQMPAETWERVVTECPWVLEKLGGSQDLSVRLIDVKKALKAGEVVPGADLADNFSLRVT